MPAGKWKEQWEAAKKAFKKATGKKKPKSTIDNKASKKTGLAALLKDCDKNYNYFIQNKPVKKTPIKKLEDALKTFKAKSIQTQLKARLI